MKFINFNGYWKKAENGESTQPTLKNLNLHFKQKGFYGVVGKIGGGKSSLLLAILEEIPYCQGRLMKQGSVAFVEQEPLIFSTTVRQNILFGKPLEKEKYKRVLECCCLEEDLNMWEKGDETMVGERGLTLSGGQKARISLGRALYSDSDIYLLDDPFSAVDAKVGRRI